MGEMVKINRDAMATPLILRVTQYHIIHNNVLFTSQNVVFAQYSLFLSYSNSNPFKSHSSPYSLIENESKVLLFAPYTRQNKRNAQKKNHDAHGILAGIRFDANMIQNARFVIVFRRIQGVQRMKIGEYRIYTS